MAEPARRRCDQRHPERGHDRAHHPVHRDGAQPAELEQQRRHGHQLSQVGGARQRERDLAVPQRSVREHDPGGRHGPADRALSSVCHPTHHTPRPG
jgi:hypothetical protein